MNKKNVLAILLTIVLSNVSTFAAQDSATNTVEGSTTKNSSDANQFQKVVDEYKAYISKISPDLRKEIVAYRKEVSKINKQKRDLYQKLSQEAQGYLAKEQEYKKRLPMKRKKLINIQNPGDKPNKE